MELEVFIFWANVPVPFAERCRREPRRKIFFKPFHQLHMCFALKKKKTYENKPVVYTSVHIHTNAGLLYAYSISNMYKLYIDIKRYM